MIPTWADLIVIVAEIVLPNLVIVIDGSRAQLKNGQSGNGASYFVIFAPSLGQEFQFDVHLSLQYLETTKIVDFSQKNIPIDPINYCFYDLCYTKF